MNVTDNQQDTARRELHYAALLGCCSGNSCCKKTIVGVFIPNTVYTGVFSTM